MPDARVAMLTAGGLAPCLASAVGALIERYSELSPDVEIVGYRSGYRGLLLGESIPVTPEVRAQAGVLHRHGGSPLGNSRVKLTNVADCVKRGLVREGQDPLQVAAETLARDGITILHTIGGDDTNMTAADLAGYLAQNGYQLTVVGLPKTIDNDIYPVRQSLGAWTAAEQGAVFFENVVNEGTTSPRTLLIHEVMGRHSGWLTAATAAAHRKRVAGHQFLPAFHLDPAHHELDGVYVPEIPVDLVTEGARLRTAMDRKDAVNIFVSEGALLDEAVRDMEERGDKVERDPFGHIRLDKVNVGEWLSRRLGKLVGAERTLVQKSGYFARSAAPNEADLALIRAMADIAVESGFAGRAGVVGEDEDQGDRLRVIEFSRIRGGKPLNIRAEWFTAMLDEIGQPLDKAKVAQHAGLISG